MLAADACNPLTAKPQILSICGTGQLETAAAFELSLSRQIGAKQRSFSDLLEGDVEAAMTYRIVATKDDQTLRSERESLLIAAAKARVWASEGWQVIVTDAEGKTLDPAALEGLFAPPDPRRAKLREVAARLQLAACR
ncbi:MAG: hypothetical protein ACRECL_04065 [Bradyrhizobium sp.]